MSKMHHHDCNRPGCTNRVECADSNLEVNYDGAPAVICRAVHLPGGSMADVLCEDCVNTPSCDHCGATATRRERDLTGVCSYCEKCYQREVVNYDPTPSELPSGSSVGPETRQQAAWEHKRAR